MFSCYSPFPCVYYLSESLMEKVLQSVNNFPQKLINQNLSCAKVVCKIVFNFTLLKTLYPSCSLKRGMSYL